MTRYIINRVLGTIPMMLAISIITFIFINVAPGDPIMAMINPAESQLTAQDIQRMRESLGLNKPVPVRYVLWLGQAVQGNLGYSYITSQPVLTRITQRLPATL